MDGVITHVGSKEVRPANAVSATVNPSPMIRIILLLFQFAQMQWNASRIPLQEVAMSSEFSDSIRKSFGEKDLDELIKLWEEHNTEEYSPEAFEILKKVIAEKGAFVREAESPVKQPKPARAISFVVVEDIDISFMNMVRFMVKWALAAIPAALILMFIFYAVMFLIAGLFGGMGGLFRF